jgi:hypothetical protein
VKSCDEFYAPGTLTRTRTIDEDGNETNEFIDNDGRVVCKQVKVSSTVNASTYYLYDDFGSLQVVIQPEGAKALTDRTVRTSQGFVLDNWAFQYRYDGRRRMTHKKVPGAEWVYMVYDDRDRLVMTQDGEQRKTNTWKFTRYDALNRPVVTGLYSHSSFLDQAGMSALIDTSNLYETFIGGSDFFGYTNVVMPPDRFTGTFEPLTITYYDDYSFLNNDPYFKYRWTSLKGQYQFTPPGRDPFPRVAGYVTGTWIRVLGKDRQWLRTVNYYDDKYRIIQTITDNHKRGQDILTNVYDFTGKVLANRTESVDHHLVWGDSHPTVQRQEDRVRNTGPNNTFSPWASSIQQVGSNSDGWVEFTCSSVTTAATTRIFGFSTSSTALNVGYGVRQDIINSSSTVRAYENNVAKGATVAVQGGDVIRIERKNMSMLYSKNGVAFYTTTLASRPALFAQTYLNQANAELFNPRISIAGPTKSIERHFEYDHAGRLLKTWHRADGADSVLLVKNEYNELGQLIDKKLHSIDNVHFRQSLDYRYNIRGWITSIIWSTTCGRR